jgi:quinol monooxygenase YgiN
MSVPVLIGFAGVLVAAVGTGLLAGRCFRQPRLDLILWTASTLGLTIALAAQAMGFDRGFSPATFRAVQLFAVLLAPLWLGWGLVERVAASDAARFSMRLVCSALTVVAGVILATDPLSTHAFGKSWPLAAQHYQPIADYVLDAVQVVAVIAAVATAGLAAARMRSDQRWLAALAGIGPVALAVLITAALRFSLPSRSLYPLLSLLAAALAWFGASRLTQAPARAGRPERMGRMGRMGRTRAARAGADPGGAHRGSGAARGVLADRYPPADEYPPPDVYPPPDEYPPANDNGLIDAPYRRAGPTGRDADRDPRPGRAGSGAPPTYGRPQEAGWSAPGPLDAGWSVPGPLDAGWQAPGLQATAGFGDPAATAAFAGGAAEFGGSPRGATTAGPAGSAGSAGAPAVARPYGRILIFTLLEDRVADFDRLAEQTAEEVMTSEPDTLVYVIHLVPNAPMQRIFYEIYRDRAAFDWHESQPYMQRFVADRRSLVLATNVIELRLKFAKVAPLPNPSPDPDPPAIPQAQLPSGPGAQLPPGRDPRLPAGQGWGPAGQGWGPAGQGWGPSAPPSLPPVPQSLPPLPPSLPPLPPTRTQRRYGGG